MKINTTTKSSQHLCPKAVSSYDTHITVTNFQTPFFTNYAKVVQNPYTSSVKLLCIPVLPVHAIHNYIFVQQFPVFD